MENTAKIICSSLVIITFLFTACTENKAKDKSAASQVQNDIVLKTQQSDKEHDSVKCFNDPGRFSKTLNRLLYRDSLGLLYLRRINEVHKNPDRPLNKCQKLPHIFLNEMALLNDSILLLDDVLDLESFKKFTNTDTFYKDKNRAYVFQEYPVTYPSFFEIELDIGRAVVIDSVYIKDTARVYHQGVKLEAADARSFTSRVYRDSLGMDLTMVYDKNNIYHYSNPYSVERLNSLSLPIKQLDSIRAIYFQ